MEERETLFSLLTQDSQKQFQPLSHLEIQQVWIQGADFFAFLPIFAFANTTRISSVLHFQFNHENRIEINLYRSVHPWAPSHHHYCQKVLLQINRSISWTGLNNYFLLKQRIICIKFKLGSNVALQVAHLSYEDLLASGLNFLTWIFSTNSCNSKSLTADLLLLVFVLLTVPKYFPSALAELKPFWIEAILLPLLYTNLLYLNPV